MYRIYDFNDDQIERDIRHGKINRDNFQEAKPIKGGSNSCFGSGEDQSILIDNQPRLKTRKPLLKESGVKIFKADYSGGSNNDIKASITSVDQKPIKSGKKPSEWQSLVKKTMQSKGLSLKDTLKYIKDNNLYKKK